MFTKMNMIKEIKNSMKCTRCILNENYPYINFNSGGVCNYCLNSKKYHVEGGHRLKEIFNVYKGKHPKYDCVVPVSGGRDSTFVLYMLVHVYKLRVLAVHYDDGLRDEQSLLNIKNIVEKLNVDLVTVKSKRDLRVKLIKEHFRSTAHFGPKQFLLGICAGCAIGIRGSAYKIAMSEKIPLIIWGSHDAEDSYGTSLRKFVYQNDSWIKANIISRLPRFLNIRYLYYNILLKLEFKKYFKYEKYVKEIPFFNYIRWNERVILKVIKDKLNWQSSPKYISPWRFDCKVHAVKNCLIYNLYGFSESDNMLSFQIRNNYISREEAIRRLEAEKTDLDIKKLYFYLKELNNDEYSISKLMETIQKRGNENKKHSY